MCPSSHFSPQLKSLVSISVLVAAVVASGGQARATTTLEETICPKGSSAFRKLGRCGGERHIVREAGLGKASPDRREDRRSLFYFAQVTDLHIADEMSPARVELIDPADSALSPAWRPQEAMGTHVLDQMVRGINDNSISPTSQGNGRRRKMDLAISSGDAADNQQLNETRWYIDVLNGRRIDPFSGQRVSSTNPCPGISPQETASLNRSVRNRQYVGVQDYEDYPGRPNDRYQGFWDPDVPPPGGGLYRHFPRYPNLMNRAQRPFRPEGLDVGWFTARGNHDGLAQGNIAITPFIKVVAPGCSKVFPNAQLDPNSLANVPGGFPALFQDPNFVNSLLTTAETVPSDQRRRFVSKVEYKDLHKGEDNSHGFGLVDKNQLRESNNNASYYALPARRDLMFISLDTVAEGGGANGNLDDPQFSWLENELRRNSAFEWSDGKLVRTGGRNRLIVIFSHHSMGTLDNPTPDEAAGTCSDNLNPTCDSDPRDSQPIHLGMQGPNSLLELLQRFPSVILYVNGHTHRNAVQPFRRPDGKSGFWQMTTASHIDWPQQARLVEIMDNGNSTLSIFGTLINHTAPIDVPPSGTNANRLANFELASISRILAFNDPQSKQDTSGADGRGARTGRNVELLINDPRQLTTARK